MKKIVNSLIVVALASNILFANSNVANITDIKESLYYLIKDKDHDESRVSILEAKTNKLEENYKDNAQHLQELKKENEILKNRLDVVSYSENSNEDKVIYNFVNSIK